MTADSTASWLLRRLLPLVLTCLAGAVAAGLARGLVMFMPGICGMAAGGVIGYVCGRIARHDPPEAWTPGQRLWFAAGVAVLYGVTAAAVVSTLRTGVMGSPLEWLIDVVRGGEGEFFFGVSRNSYQAVSGTISGAWWLFFNLLDIVLFLALFFVSMVGGLESASGPVRSVADGSRNDRLDSAPVTPGVPSFGTAPRPMRAGRRAGAACLLVAGGVLTSLAFGPSVMLAFSGAPSADELIRSLQGDWQFDEGASFLGDTARERTFTLSRVFERELAGISAEPNRFVMSVQRRSDGVFEGRIVIRGRVAVPVRMRLGPDGQTLDLVVELLSPAGRSTRHVSAHRLPP